jgi:hypothetical protein
MDYYLAIKRNEIPKYLSMLSTMDCENVVSERRQTSLGTDDSR